MSRSQDATDDGGYSSRLHLFIRGGVEPRSVTVHHCFGVVRSRVFNVKPRCSNR